MRWLAAAALFAILIAGCTTTRPSAALQPIPAISAASAPAAVAELAARRASFAGARAFVRIRATTRDRIRSFNAQIAVDSAGRMLLIAYTPIGTQAIRIYSEGERVLFVSDIQHAAWSGATAEFGHSFGFFGPSPSLSPIAFLLLGLPADGHVTGAQEIICTAGMAGCAPGTRLTRFASRDGAITYIATAGGLASAAFGTGSAVTFDPPGYPPAKVSIIRGDQRLDVTYREIGTTTEPIAPLEVPKGYRESGVPGLP
ncbi:MAG TPA: hypothetical protein VEZ11_04870 [Thermoanaerobaculia bacterium]|nr:hypothetical protein [Thermoanaerobaculia bacterium]